MKDIVFPSIIPDYMVAEPMAKKKGLIWSFFFFSEEP